MNMPVEDEYASFVSDLTKSLLSQLRSARQPSDMDLGGKRRLKRKSDPEASEKNQEQTDPWTHFIPRESAAYSLSALDLASSALSLPSSRSLSLVLCEVRTPRWVCCSSASDASASRARPSASSCSRSFLPRARLRPSISADNRSFVSFRSSVGGETHQLELELGPLRWRTAFPTSSCMCVAHRFAALENPRPSGRVEAARA
jgi:hypothetical protein